MNETCACCQQLATMNGIVKDCNDTIKQLKKENDVLRAEKKVEIKYDYLKN